MAASATYRSPAPRPLSGRCRSERSETRTYLRSPSSSSVEVRLPYSSASRCCSPPPRPKHRAHNQVPTQIQTAPTHSTLAASAALPPQHRAISALQPRRLFVSHIASQTLGRSCSLLASL